MVDIGVNLTSEVEGEHIWVAAMIDKSGLIPIEHTIETQREKLIVVDFLNDLLFFIFFAWVVEIKQVTESVSVVIGASHVALLFAHDLAKVLHQECPSRHLFHGNKSPHANVFGPL